MNVAKKSDAVEASAFMPLADGPLAPPEDKRRKKAAAPTDGLRDFLGGRAKKRKRARG